MRKVPNSDILFLTPPVDSFTVTPPIGQIHLATVLQKSGFKVSLYDSLAGAGTEKEMIDFIAEVNPGVIGMTLMTPRFASVAAAVLLIREKFPDVRIILGGPHPSALPESTLKQLDIDLVFIGEGEDHIGAVVTAIRDRDPVALRAIPGIAWRENGEIIRNPGHNAVADLNSIPVPDWTFASPGDYPRKPAQLLYRSFPIGSIMTSRGCRYKCSFCASTTVAGPGVRWRHRDLIVDEMEQLYRDHGVREFHILDDNFAGNKTESVEICEEIIRRGLKIHWKVPGGLRLDGVNRELLSVYKASGCYELGFGIESLDRNVNKFNRKALNVDMIEERLKLVKSFGIDTYGYFIIGLPGETLSSLRKTVLQAPRLSLDFYHYSLFTPMPGAPNFHEVIPPAEAAEMDWSKFLFGKGAFRSWCEVPYRVLKRYHFLALVLSFLKVRRIFKILGALKFAQYGYFFRLVTSYLQVKSAPKRITPVGR